MTPKQVYDYENVSGELVDLDSHVKLTRVILVANFRRILSRQMTDRITNRRRQI